MNENEEEDKMSVTQVKPIRPTKANFKNEKDAEKFEVYASQIKKTESVGMNKVRQMMEDFKKKRK